jgi:membrane protease YdiL (CAAX protease family)
MTGQAHPSRVAEPWRGGLLWTIGFLAFPALATSLLFRLASALGANFAPLQPVVASFLVYGVACLIAVAGLWAWAMGRGLARSVFAFRPLSWADWLVALAGLAIGLFVLFPVADWLAQHFFGAGIGGALYGRETPLAVPVMAVAAVLIAPFAEEVLFRGLGVAYLASCRLSAPAIWLVVTVAFALTHLPGFGLAGGIFTLLWGGMTTAIRQWRGNLSPGLALHIANNAIAYLVFPLLMPKG